MCAKRGIHRRCVLNRVYTDVVCLSGNTQTVFAEVGIHRSCVWKGYTQTLYAEGVIYTLCVLNWVYTDSVC